MVYLAIFVNRALLTWHSVFIHELGKLQHLDLTGNALCSQPTSIAMLKKYVADGHIDIVLPVPNSTTQFPYDDDP